MKFIKSRRCLTSLLFCSLFSLATPAFAEIPTHETTKPEATIPTTDQNQARKRYNERSLYALHLNIAPLATYNDYLSDSWFSPQHGQHGPPLTNQEFYQALGDQNLLDQYNSNRSKKTVSNVMVIGGVIGTLGSLTWVTLTLLGDALSSSALGSGESREKDPNYALPLGALAISAASLITGVIIAPTHVHPIRIDDATNRINTHNNNLKQELGLPQNYSPHPSASRVQYDLDLVATTDSTELRLKLNF